MYIHTLRYLVELPSISNKVRGEEQLCLGTDLKGIVRVSFLGFPVDGRGVLPRAVTIVWSDGTGQLSAAGQQSIEAREGDERRGGETRR